jgi:methyl-accepting chemotaxis protein
MEIQKAADATKVQSEQIARAMSEQTRALREMTIGAQNITKQIGIITRANREHSAGADTVLKALNEVRSITQENTKSLWAITDLLEIKGAKSAPRTSKGRAAKAGS